MFLHSDGLAIWAGGEWVAGFHKFCPQDDMEEALKQSLLEGLSALESKRGEEEQFELAKQLSSMEKTDPTLLEEDDPALQRAIEKSIGKNPEVEQPRNFSQHVPITTWTLTKWTLKVQCGSDSRRVPVEWAHGASNDEIYIA
eukprot:5032993-Amphidinium_carterae.1